MSVEPVPPSGDQRAGQDCGPDGTELFTQPTRRHRRWLKPLIVTGSVVLVLALVAGVALWFGARNQGDGSDAKVRTATVERTSLTSGLQLSGSLGYGKPTDLAGGGGVVTALPEAGQEYSAGQVLFEVEANPVYLVHGDIPLWRELKPGVSGPDVNALRSGLRELDLDAGADNPTYDAPLAKAVEALYAKDKYAPPGSRDEPKKAKLDAQNALAEANKAVVDAQAALQAARQGPSEVELVEAQNAINKANRDLAAAWAGDEGLSVPDAQDALNLALAQMETLEAPKDTSAERAAVDDAIRLRDQAQAAANQAALCPVGPKDILMIPTKTIRVDTVKVQKGVAAEGPVLSWTDTTIFARVELTEAQRSAMATGAEVTVALPDGTELPGIIGDITNSKVTDFGEFIPASARIDIADQEELQQTGLTAVTIKLVQEEAGDSLVVPVTALLALIEGGYAVELKDGTLIGVDVGLVADTRAVVTPTVGDLAEGDEVVIP